MDERVRVHGSIPAEDRGRFARAGRPLLDLSANVSPYGPAKAVATALREVALDCYPDPQGRRAREAVAAHFDVSPEAVAIGNGAAELIWAVARARLDRGASALQLQPTFSEFALAVASCNAPLLSCTGRETDGFAVDLSALSAQLTRADAALCYVCTPNNPTGVGCAFAELNQLAQRHPRVWFLVDQAYLSLSPRHGDLAMRPLPNVICLRSLTKEQSLPGVRVGYLIAAPSLVAQIERQRPSWSVNALAQAVVAPALAARDHVARVREKMLQDRERAQGILQQVGISSVRGEGPFLLARVADAAACVHWLLHEEAIALRDCSSFGLPQHVRLAGVQAEAAPRLLAALSAWNRLQGG